MSDSLHIILLGTGASLIASLGTTLGATGILLVRKLSMRAQDILLASAAGVMPAAAVFSLLIPAIEQGLLQGHSKAGAALAAVAGLFIGALLLALIHHYTPHQHFLKGREGVSAERLSGIWLFVIAITLHNFPEGMAVGVGFAEGDVANGLPLMTGILLQNIPEGLAIAVSLFSIGYSRGFSFTLALLTGLVEPVGGFLGAALISSATGILPWILGAAAGAMLFIISNEIIPETHKNEHENAATFALMGGFGLMVILDQLLG